MNNTTFVNTIITRIDLPFLNEKSKDKWQDAILDSITNVGLESGMSGYFFLEMVFSQFEKMKKCILNAYAIVIVSIGNNYQLVWKRDEFLCVFLRKINTDSYDLENDVTLSDYETAYNYGNHIYVGNALFTKNRPCYASGRKKEFDCSTCSHYLKHD